MFVGRKVNTMNIDINSMISITDANHNFSKATKTVEDYGYTLILKNNEPKYYMFDMSLVEEKDVEAIMKKIVANKKKASKK